MFYAVESDNTQHIVTAFRKRADRDHFIATTSPGANARIDAIPGTHPYVRRWWWSFGGPTSDRARYCAHYEA